MEVYVAGKYEERAIVIKIQNALIANGHTITHDWTTHEDFNLLPEYAMCDVDGVRQCDVLIAYMVNDLNYSGTLSEIGMALAFEKKVIIIGDAFSRSIFVNHPLVRVESAIEDAIALVEEYECTTGDTRCYFCSSSERETRKIFGVYLCYFCTIRIAKLYSKGNRGK